MIISLAFSAMDTNRNPGLMNCCRLPRMNYGFNTPISHEADSWQVGNGETINSIVEQHEKESNIDRNQIPH